MFSKINDFFRSLLMPIDGRVLGLFRLLFGAMMVYQCSYYFKTNLIDDGFMKPYVLFKYDGLEFIDRLPREWMFGLLGVLALSAIGIATGVLFRVSAYVFAGIQLYFLLLEKAYYNNHIYLFVLLAFLLGLTNAHHFLSLRSGKDRLTHVPYWQQWILQAQIVIVYFYASFVKLKSDWLVLKQPMTTLVESYPPTRTLHGLVKLPGMVEFFTYGGAMLDLASPLLLWYKPFRKYALIPFLLFHLVNGQIFNDIGVFPYVMATALLLFYLPNELFWWKNSTSSASTASSFMWSNSIKWTLICYFIFQLLFPLRGYLLPNALDYTTIGNRFAWRVKADTRKADRFDFYAIHPELKQKIIVDSKVFINPVQAQHVASDPRSMLQFANALSKEGLKQGVQGMMVTGVVKVGYNGRPTIDMIDSTIDLTRATYSVWEPIIWVNEPLWE
jgi:vitamin K-dependent gamma-carboxylase